MPQAGPAEYHALGYYSIENAEKWLDLDAFMAWLSHSFRPQLKEKLCNSLTVSSTSTPVASCVKASIMSKNLNRSQPGASSSLFSLTPWNSHPRYSSPPIKISDSSEYESTPSKPQKKRKRRNSPPAYIKQEDSDNLEVEIVQVKPIKAVHHCQENLDSNCEVKVIKRKQHKAKECALDHPKASKENWWREPHPDHQAVQLQEDHYPHKNSDILVCARWLWRRSRVPAWSISRHTGVEGQKWWSYVDGSHYRISGVWFLICRIILKLILNLGSRHLGRRKWWAFISKEDTCYSPPQ